ncbi:hypothetical protein [Fortiea contorta]|uniref:hypothetical protein n=1 Tax=Fortiea contorta TaxID=1892405 RepID=UPI00034868F0|nr:hypothetical protein [Fortiea contorta]
MEPTTIYPLITSLLIGLLGQPSTPQSLNSQAEIIARLSEINVIKVSQATSTIDEKTAFNLVWKLPIVQRKAREIEKLSKGTIRLTAVLDSSPTPDETYYTIRVVENHVKHVDTIYWFRVLTPSGNIEVLDLVDNQYIPLNKWKPN